MIKGKIKSLGEIVIRVYDISDEVEREVSSYTTSMGGNFGDIMTVIDSIDFAAAPNIGDACDIDGDGIPDCPLSGYIEGTDPWW